MADVPVMVSSQDLKAQKRKERNAVAWEGQGWRQCFFLIPTTYQQIKITMANVRIEAFSPNFCGLCLETTTINIDTSSISHIDVKKKMQCCDPFNRPSGVIYVTENGKPHATALVLNLEDCDKVEQILRDLMEDEQDRRILR
ncbi:hypothetical protein GUITHDRAFT_122910 [Guillardia theta CCMP2712]|nr:hypothetical protein GUITHDRAFT_122910 [Guillardia theta CCMP2712]EKX30884.1 hypothetical protein GUITHDRAFT_122910 [Guillardia theta CCMP2712]|eukprot:XP_005817864.1 hypothetical protein GUITHDRAFT_122910 [Guillardia theta CCMP2712]